MCVPAIVLIGGLGTRIRPAIGNIPKCLAPIGKTFFLKILLDSILNLGVERVILSLGYGSELVLSELKGLNLTFESFTEDVALGTGGAIKAVMDAFMLDEALVFNGDSIIFGEKDRSILLPLDLEENELCRIVSVYVSDKSRFGGLVFKNERVTAFIEKGECGSGFINAGIYRVSNKVFMKAPKKDSFSLELDIFPKLVDEGSLSFCKNSGEFIDIGIPDDYLRFKDLYLHWKPLLKVG